MRLLNFLFFASFLILALFSQTCTVDSSDFSSSQSVSPQTSAYLLSPDEELIGSENYGQLISVGSRIWMMKKVFSLTRTYKSFGNPCPQGWMLPTLVDLNNLLLAVNADPLAVLTNSSLFDMNPGNYYMSSEKAYPESTSGSVLKSWAFYGIKFLATGLPQIAIVSTWYYPTYLKAYCVKQKASEIGNSAGVSGLVVKGIDNRDLYKGLKYVLSVNNTNVVDFAWSLAGIQSNSKYFDVIPMKEGEYQLNYKVKLFDGSVIGDCKTIWVRNYTGSEADTMLSVEDIRNVTYPFFDYRNKVLHFNSGSAPLAPKEEGGTINKIKHSQ